MEYNKIMQTQYEVHLVLLKYHEKTIKGLSTEIQHEKNIILLRIKTAIEKLENEDLHI